jgi:segregation and condensation protein B
MSVIDYSWDFAKEEFSLDLDFFNEKEQEDKLWQARTGLNPETLCGAIETIIFMSDRPVNLQKIKAQIDPDLPLRVIHESISRLQEEYEAKHHGIRLMEVAMGYQFRTKATYSKVIQNMFKVSSMQLSPTALEVMAIIAYKQPISKTAVESIRGVDSSHVVRQLMDKRLVRIVGRSDEMGRPSLYGTSQEFLEVFNLNTVEDLPSESELHELATATDLGEISDIKSIVNSGDKKIFNFDEFEELEGLTSQIKDIASGTMFTECLKDMDKKRKSKDDIEKKSAFDILEEFVNSSEIIDQNKLSMESETLMAIMEPRSVDVTNTNEILNAPEMEEDDGDIVDFAIDIELENDEDSERELPPVELILTEEFNNEEIEDLDSTIDQILAKSENLIQEVIETPEATEALEAAAISEKAEEVAQPEANDLDSILNQILVSSETTEQESVEESIPELPVQETVAKEAVELSEEELAQAKEDLNFEAEELSDALDMAFDNLFEGVEVEKAEEETQLSDENFRESTDIDTLENTNLD